MSKYSGLDKVVLESLKFVENYSGGKIYIDEDGTYTVTKRKFMIDEQIALIKDARWVIDHFNTV